MSDDRTVAFDETDIARVNHAPVPPDPLQEVREDILRYKEHSEILNKLSWRMKEILGDVEPGQEAAMGDPLIDIERLAALIDIERAVAQRQTEIVVAAQTELKGWRDLCGAVLDPARDVYVAQVLVDRRGGQRYRVWPDDRPDWPETTEGCWVTYSTIPVATGSLYVAVSFFDDGVPALRHAQEEGLRTVFVPFGQTLNQAIEADVESRR